MFAVLGGRKPFAMAWIELPGCCWWVADWRATAANPWGIEVEQMNRYGAFRHRTFDDNLNLLPWVKGPHPIAQKLRDEGKEETDGFNKVNRQP